MEKVYPANNPKSLVSRKSPANSVVYLDTARNNFTNLLKKWSTKKSHNYEDRNNHHNSTTQSFGSQNDYDEFDDEASPPLQKTKRLKKETRKSSKKRPSSELTPVSNDIVQPSTCMLKLFDRSVDLAQFNENSPLYTLCRAWVKNPASDESKDLDNENDEQLDSMNVDENDEFIYQLPKPEPAKRDLRIPKSVKKPTTSAKEIDKAINSSKFEKFSKEELLAINQKRWKEVRTEWKKASLENEKRYRKSWLILKEMYDKTLASQAEPIS